MLPYSEKDSDLLFNKTWVSDFLWIDLLKNFCSDLFSQVGIMACQTTDTL
jgi:hypothetical protein